MASGLPVEVTAALRAFVTALKNLCKANLLAIREILKVRPDAIFIQSESAEYFHIGGADSQCRDLACFENDRRFLSFDLLFSHRPNSTMTLYLLGTGEVASDVADEANRIADPSFDVIGVVSDNAALSEQLIPMLGSLRELADVVRKRTNDIRLRRDVADGLRSSGGQRQRRS